MAPKKLFVVRHSKMSLETLPPDYKQTFMRLIGLLKFIGVDIFGAKLGCNNVDATVRVLIHAICFLPLAITIDYGLLFRFNEYKSFVQATTMMPSLIITTLYLIKGITAIVMRNDIKELLLETGELWPTHVGDGEMERVFMKWQQNTTYINKPFFIFSTGVSCFFYIIPFIRTVYSQYTGDNEYYLPFESPCFWLINSNSVYLATYILQLPLMVGQVCLYLSSDVLITIVIFNISVLFSMLQVDLQDAIQATCAKRTNLGVLDADFDRIKKIVVKHQKILSLVDSMNSCFGFVVLMHTALSSMLICFFFFMTASLDNRTGVVFNLLASVEMSVNVFLLTLAGQILYDTSSGLATAAYESIWCECDLKVQKCVAIIIVRSQQPCYLNAMGFTTMTLATFTKIMSSAWTYLSVLTQLYESN